MDCLDKNIFEIVCNTDDYEIENFMHSLDKFQFSDGDSVGKHDNDNDMVDIHEREKENLKSEQKYLEYQGNQQYQQPWGLSSDIRVVDSDELPDPHPITDKVECSKCGNNQAHWWIVQTDSADEPITQFFRCIKCRLTWRTAKTS